VLLQLAFSELEQIVASSSASPEAALDAFLLQNSNDGWLFPETTASASIDGAGSFATTSRHVIAGLLGPRFFDWQLSRSVEESWRECELHAGNLQSGILAQRDGEQGAPDSVGAVLPSPRAKSVAEPPPQTSLFG
jgi:hypothetical protein